jgi:hypothetical protein
MERDGMSAEEKKKRGAPKGNQNARKRGFYARVMDEADLIDFNLAAGVNGADDEIALRRPILAKWCPRQPSGHLKEKRGTKKISPSPPYKKERGTKGVRLSRELVVGKPPAHQDTDQDKYYGANPHQ